MAILMGMRVQSDHYLVRRSTYATGEYSRRSWEPRKGKVVGWYVGFRTYSDGELRGGYSFDDPSYFVPKRYFKVALIVTSERTNPVPVLFEDMVREAHVIRS